MFTQYLQLPRRLAGVEFLTAPRFAQIGQIPGCAGRNSFELSGKLPEGHHD